MSESQNTPGNTPVNPYESPRTDSTDSKWPWAVRGLPSADWARNILDSLRAYNHPEHEYRVVFAEDYPRVNRRFYRKTQAALEAVGFRLLGDIEDATLRGAGPSRPTFIRTMVDPHETTVAAFFHLPLRIHVRIVAWLLRMPNTCVDLESRTTAGRTYCTTILPERMLCPHPDSFLRDFAPRSLRPDELYARHRHMLEAGQRTGELARIRGISDVIAWEKRERREVYRYLEQIGWATRDYLRYQRVPESQVDEVYAEIQRLLQAAAAGNDREATGGDERASLGS